MSLGGELGRTFPGRFRVLILDNEVTVDAFVTAPPLPWARLTAVDGDYRVGEGYPGQLTAAEADREERNWDRVSPDLLTAVLAALDRRVDLLALGNNAGQGLPLALAVPEALRPGSGVIVYGTSLPERPAYEAAGYRRFCRRVDLVGLVHDLAAGRPAALAFINTIEHDERNYHAPWAGRGGGQGPAGPAAIPC